LEKIKVITYIVSFAEFLLALAALSLPTHPLKKATPHYTTVWNKHDFQTFIGKIHAFNDLTHIRFSD